MILLPRTSRQVAARADLSIVAFGSSTTEGVGATKPTCAYPPLLQHRLREALPGMNVQVSNRGVGGENAADMLARMERDVILPCPDLVIWQTGVNDALRHDPVEKFLADTRAALARIARAGSDCILMEQQWCPMLDGAENSETYLMALRSLGAELAFPVYPRFDLMREWLSRGDLSYDCMIAPDGLHLRDACYAKIAATLADYILTWAGVGSREPLGQGAPASGER